MIVNVYMHPTYCVDAAWRHGGQPFTGERMLKMMDGPYYVNGKPRRVDWGSHPAPAPETLSGRTACVVASGGGIRDYMAYCARLVQAYPDRFIGNFTYNPRFGVENWA